MDCLVLLNQGVFWHIPDFFNYPLLVNKIDSEVGDIICLIPPISNACIISGD